MIQRGKRLPLQLAIQWCVVKRALIMALIVGSILVSINHGMCICMGKFDFTCFWQSALTFMVPYAVSTISSVMAMMDSTKSDSKPD